MHRNKHTKQNTVAIMHLYCAVTAKATTDQTFEATVTKKTVLSSFKRFYHKPEEVDCLKIAHQFCSQTLWSALTIMGPTNPAKATVYSELCC